MITTQMNFKNDQTTKPNITKNDSPKYQYLCDRKKLSRKKKRIKGSIGIMNIIKQVQPTKTDTTY